MTESNLPQSSRPSRATYSFKLTIRDKEHFYAIVDWLNKNVGKGSEFWTMEGRPLRSLQKTRTSVKKSIYIFKDDFDPASALYLALIY
jgi:hypothetical protein